MTTVEMPQRWCQYLTMILLSGSLLWLGSRSTNDSVVIQENWSLWKCDVLVDVKMVVRKILHKYQNSMEIKNRKLCCWKLSHFLVITNLCSGYRIGFICQDKYQWSWCHYLTMILLSGSLLWLGSRSTNDSVVIQEIMQLFNWIDGIFPCEM